MFVQVCEQKIVIVRNSLLPLVNNFLNQGNFSIALTSFIHSLDGHNVLVTISHKNKICWISEWVYKIQVIRHHQSKGSFNSQSVTT